MLKENRKNNKKFIKLTVISLVIGAVLSVALMALFAMLIVLFQIDRSYASPLATVSIAAGCFAASFMGGRKIGKNGYLFGLINGVGVFLTITLIALLISDWDFGLNTVFHFVILTMASVAGGIMGVNRIKSKKYI